MRNRFSRWPIYLINLILVRYALKRREMTAHSAPAAGDAITTRAWPSLFLFYSTRNHHPPVTRSSSQISFCWSYISQHPTLHKELIKCKLFSVYFNRVYIYLFSNVLLVEMNFVAQGLAQADGCMPISRIWSTAFSEWITLEWEGVFSMQDQHIPPILDSYFLKLRYR